MAATSPPSFRVIAYFDVDCFYAQAEELRNPKLKGKAVGVTQKFLVVTCNYPARAMGIRKLMKTSDAVKLAGKHDLVLIPGEDLTPYRDASDAMLAALQGLVAEEQSRQTTVLLLQKKIAPFGKFGARSKTVVPVERGGLDEFVVDLTCLAQAELSSPAKMPTSTEFQKPVFHHASEGSIADQNGRPQDRRAAVPSEKKGCGCSSTSSSSSSSNELVGGSRQSSAKSDSSFLLAAGARVAARLKAGLEQATGFTSSAGVGGNRLCAKLAAGLHKPNGLTVLPPRENLEFLKPLPVRSLSGIGSVTYKRLVAATSSSVGHVHKSSEGQSLPLTCGKLRTILLSDPSVLAATMSSAALVAAAARVIESIFRGLPQEKATAKWLAGVVILGVCNRPVGTSTLQATATSSQLSQGGSSGNSGGPKVVSREDSFAPLTTHAALRRVLAVLGPDLVHALRRDDLRWGPRRARRLTVTWRAFGGRTMNNPTGGCGSGPSSGGVGGRDWSEVMEAAAAGAVVDGKKHGRSVPLPRAAYGNTSSYSHSTTSSSGGGGGGYTDEDDLEKITVDRNCGIPAAEIPVVNDHSGSGGCSTAAGSSGGIGVKTSSGNELCSEIASSATPTAVEEQQQSSLQYASPFSQLCGSGDSEQEAVTKVETHKEEGVAGEESHVFVFQRAVAEVVGAAAAVLAQHLRSPFAVSVLNLAVSDFEKVSSFSTLSLPSTQNKLPLLSPPSSLVSPVPSSSPSSPLQQPDGSNSYLPAHCPPSAVMPTQQSDDQLRYRGTYAIVTLASSSSLSSSSLSTLHSKFEERALREAAATIAIATSSSRDTADGFGHSAYVSTGAAATAVNAAGPSPQRAVSHIPAWAQPHSPYQKHLPPPFFNQLQPKLPVNNEYTATETTRDRPSLLLTTPSMASTSMATTASPPKQPPSSSSFSTVSRGRSASKSQSKCTDMPSVDGRMIPAPQDLNRLSHSSSPQLLLSAPTAWTCGACTLENSGCGACEACGGPHLEMEERDKALAEALQANWGAGSIERHTVNHHHNRTDIRLHFKKARHDSD